MPGLMRGMAKTAAVVGTATATRNAVNRRQADKNAQAYAQATQSAYGQPAPAMAAIPDTGYVQEDQITQLERIGALYAQGLLSDQEFAVQKAKILGY